MHAGVCNLYHDIPVKAFFATVASLITRPLFSYLVGVCTDFPLDCVTHLPKPLLLVEFQMFLFFIKSNLGDATIEKYLLMFHSFFGQVTAILHQCVSLHYIKGGNVSPSEILLITRSCNRLTL